MPEHQLITKRINTNIRQRRLYSQLKEPIFYLEIASDICVFELHTQNDRILRKNHF